MENKKKWFIACLAAAAAVLVLMLISFGSLHSDIEALERRLGSFRDEISGDIAGISGSMYSMESDVREQLELQGSILSKSELSLGFENGLLKASVTVVPKEMRPNEAVSIAFITASETVTVPAEALGGGQYFASTLLAPADALDATVLISSPELARQEALPSVDVLNSLSFTFELNDLRDLGLAEADDCRALLYCYPNYEMGGGFAPFAEAASLQLLLTDSSGKEVAAVKGVPADSAEFAGYYDFSGEFGNACLFTFDLNGAVSERGEYNGVVELTAKSGLRYRFGESRLSVSEHGTSFNLLGSYQAYPEFK